ncbi:MULTISPECIES: Tad domain-containing protein [unclassified Shewanella]|uniref:Tad domain-containing protein n=1 Tax=unclassified Shewanella TaxID=196818 RepID=UPI001BC12B62|nr:MULTISPECIES: Tad domain-containing protein [unclassified Shewanella]GIU21327.1 hypothetical protein TUM4444_40640 [Shewanella sp. MBTL60-112-B1]GIU39959.1 hypothetical protein TUM4445_38070 [Shewanella sp. MBTL60-112-B2]
MAGKSSQIFLSSLLCKKQSGAIIIMFTIGLFAIVAVAALAVDSSHMLLNKGRLQNAVDSAALSAAKKLQDGGSLYEARQNVISILSQNLGHSENNEILDVVTLSTPDYNDSQVTEHVSVEFSATPDPFIPGADETYEYVRVSVEDVGLNNFLAEILNFDKKVRASAVAGRSTDIECLNKVVPLLVCGDMSQPDDYGMGHGGLYVMKIGSKQKPSDPDITLGPGNFQLLDLGGPGGKGIEQGLAGEYSPGACVGVGQTVPTEPGNKVGPVASGLNTRFGEWPNGNSLNSTDHPRDLNTCEGDKLLVDSEASITNPTAEYYSYAAYYGQDASENPVSHDTFCKSGNILEPSTTTKADRRKLPVVIGDCTGKINGKNVVTVKSIGCFFLTQKVEHTGNTSIIIGEYISECGSSGNASLDPDFESDNFTIVLYRDPGSPDS